MLERLLWEEEQKEKEIIKTYGESDKVYKDPRKDKLKDFRKSKRGKGWYFKESKSTRKLYQCKVRAKLKKIPYREEYFTIRCRDYKTYGWIDW